MRRYAVPAVLLLALCLHLCAIGHYGWFRDELYYVACGRRLAWGYVDHPPMVAWVARTIEATGGSLIALRLVSVLVGIVVMAQAAWLAARMGGGWLASALAAFAVFSGPVNAFIFHYYSMNALEILLGTTMVCCLTLALQRRRLVDWALVGLLVGVGCLTKYGTAFYAVALFLAVAASRQRRVLMTPGPWLAVALAVLLALPHLVWQWTRGFPSLEFMENARTTKNVQFSLPGYFLAQISSVGPANAPLWLGGLHALVFKRLKGADLTWPLGIAFLLLGVFFAASGGKPYYLMLAYPPLFAAGAVVVEGWAGRARRLYAIAALAAYALLSLLVLPMGLPILPVSTMVPYARLLGGAAPKQEHGRLAELPQHYADMFGWRELVTEVRAVVETLPPTERHHAVVLALNYGQAGALELLGAEVTPPVMSPHNAYFDWGPREGGPVIAVGFDRERLLEHYQDVTRVGTKRCELCMPTENELPIHLCRSPRRELRSSWNALKTYR